MESWTGTEAAVILHGLCNNTCIVFFNNTFFVLPLHSVTVHLFRYMMLDYIKLRSPACLCNASFLLSEEKFIHHLTRLSKVTCSVFRFHILFVSVCDIIN